MTTVSLKINYGAGKNLELSKEEAYELYIALKDTFDKTLEVPYVFPTTTPNTPNFNPFPNPTPYTPDMPFNPMNPWCRVAGEAAETHSNLPDFKGQFKVEKIETT